MVQVFQTFTITQPVKQSAITLPFSQKSIIGLSPEPVQARQPVPVSSIFMLPFLLCHCHPCDVLPDIGLNCVYYTLCLLHVQSTSSSWPIWCCNIDVCTLFKVGPDGLGRPAVQHWFSPPFLIVRAPGWFSSLSHRIALL